MEQKDNLNIEINLSTKIYERNEENEKTGINYIIIYII
jgi:hypothetical protein